MGADTIRLDLYHFVDQVPDAKLSANDFLQTELKMARKGFKWKTLQNMDNGTRFQIMQWNRPKDLAIVEFNKAR